MAMTETPKKPNKNDPLTLLIKEADAYNHLDQIEKYVEGSSDLSVLPVQPVYLALRKLPLEKVAEYLPKFGKEQREIFMDIDLWAKDEIDVENFLFWIQAYSLVDSEEVKKDFVTSEQFLLFLKSRFNVWTFDAEDPNYPEHDNYFLTDDNQLLFEFDENFQYVDEARELIRHLYFELGVENAYTFLFKMVSDSFLIIQEEQYQSRKERMRDYGFVDYMDALENENPFINIDFLNLFIKKKTTTTGGIDDIAKNQNLHNSSLVAFKDHFKKVIDELLKVSDQKRADFLQFNFVRLINARLESQGSLKKGSVAMTRTGAQTKNLVLLGFNYIKATDHLTNVPDDGIFVLFSFTDLYKIGNSLIKFNLKDLKKALTVNDFDGDKEKFLGDYWSDFIDNSFDTPTKFHSPKDDTAKTIIEFDEYQMWTYKTKTLIQLMPYAQKFYETFDSLRKEGRLMDSFYINYTVDDIDFEALLLSNFANYYLSSFNEKESSVPHGKLGLTIDEYKKFAQGIISPSEGKFLLTPELFKKIQKFSESYGLNQVFDFSTYLQELLKSQLEGYDLDDMKVEDYKHVGGPIILSIVSH
ncbi:MAG: hypothetical protein K2Q18_06740 [Bdellovibrionales bacterium]|nr:hypothetical protein [Bdellovibrionales bacterium]